jgi:hypothetical protein
VQGSPPRRAAAAPVPSQHGPAGTAQGPQDAPLPPGPRVAPGAGGPLLPPELLPGARAVTLRTRHAPRPDVVVFTAACPACGEDCTWSEEREDTRVRTVVRCPCAG